ncbi:hypothetical protein MPTK1_7g01460 [Marchantia polymorpha subsp. ruderalis]|uniref:AttH domain-containing protein n=2 Tax=Marchantia polymorpha TaxID=3197 RepID=A0AAF6BV19_MARPO|nr:hypothetical protein MARPO_0099s0020 [Marchantia polymorpha]BBN15853.1 hypothetical protein Mp_7g01460 [Marchantia polymorpha subsp. ruderalis]|eukprot:PTQ32381.1 hypothetical protein MARPO_0099s0020 [Marchantia polymorpha]
MDLKDVRFYTISCAGLVVFYCVVTWVAQISGMVLGGMSTQHPLDPHQPTFSKWLPESFRPYPSFEGWYFRLLDTESNFSAAVVVATNYATQESQVTLLFTSSFKDAELIDSSSPASGGGASSSYKLRTHARAAMSEYYVFRWRRSSKFEVGGRRENRRPGEPLGFEWEAPGLGKVNMTASEARLDITIHGYTLKAHLTKNVLWDAKRSERGPEGWAKVLPLPTHWYVYSLGSRIEYDFSGPGGSLKRKGVGLGHSEKNWGIRFPDGHVWFQGFSADNSAQILGSIAYYKLGGVKTPYVGAMGYRSQAVSFDMRSVDIGTYFTDVRMSYRNADFTVTGVSASHTIKIHAKADFETLSEPILAPVTKVKWDFACRETFFATVSVEVFEHGLWGLIGDKRLVEKRTFDHAAFEFGEDLLKT